MNKTINELPFPNIKEVFKNLRRFRVKKKMKY